MKYSKIIQSQICFKKITCPLSKLFPGMHIRYIYIIIRKSTKGKTWVMCFKLMGPTMLQISLQEANVSYILA